MGERIELPVDTTNTETGTSGGKTTAYIREPARGTVPLPGVESGGIGASTAHFLDKDRQEVTRRAFGSGEGSGTPDD